LSKEDIKEKELTDYNNIALGIYNKVTLLQCPGCKRTFFPESLPIHMRGCKAAAQIPAQKEEQKNYMLPPGIVCFICGREFGTASIDIHLKACKKRWEEEESSKPVKERRPIPKTPPLFAKARAKGNALTRIEMNALNEELLKMFYEESRIPCKNCGRKFLPDRLEVHLRGCKGAMTRAGSPSPIQGCGRLILGNPCATPRNLPVSNFGNENRNVNISFEDANIKPKLLVCYICGHEYGAHSLEIHLKCCKKRWEEQQAGKLIKERRAMPKPPAGFENIFLQIFIKI